MKKFDLSESAFTRMAVADVVPFVHTYTDAVQMGDVSWLERNVPKNERLTTDNRRWLANLEFADHTPFGVHAARQHNYALLEFLLNEGAQPDLILAAGAVDDDCTAVKMALDAQADANSAYETVPTLTIPAIKFNALSCRHLLEAGAEVNAWRSGKPECTALFDSLSAYERSVQEAITAGRKPAEMSREKELQTLGTLLEFKADPYQRDGQSAECAFDIAERLKPLDPRPVKLVHSWCSEALAVLQTQRLMERLLQKKGGPAAG